MSFEGGGYMEMKETKDANTQSKDLFENGAGESNVPDMKNFVFCSNCGTKLIKGVSFCHKCGNKVMQEDAVSETQKLYESQLKYHEDNKVSLSPEQELSILKQIEDTKTKLENEKKAEEDKSFGQAPSKSSTEMKEQNPNAPAAEIGAEGSWVDNGVVLPFYTKIWFISLVGGVCAIFLSYGALVPVLILELVRVIKMRTWKHWENRFKDKMINLIPVIVVVIVSFLLGPDIGYESAEIQNEVVHNGETKILSNTLNSGKTTNTNDSNKLPAYKPLDIKDGSKVIVDSKVNSGVYLLDSPASYRNLYTNFLSMGILQTEVPVGGLPNKIMNGTEIYVFSQPPALPYINDPDHPASKFYANLFGLTYAHAEVSTSAKEYTDDFAFVAYLSHNDYLDNYIETGWVKKSDLNMYISDSREFDNYMMEHALNVTMEDLYDCQDTFAANKDELPIEVYAAKIVNIDDDYVEAIRLKSTYNQKGNNFSKEMPEDPENHLFGIKIHDDINLNEGDIVTVYGFYNSISPEGYPLIDGYHIHFCGDNKCRCYDFGIDANDIKYISYDNDYDDDRFLKGGNYKNLMAASPSSTTHLTIESTPAPTAAPSYDEMDDWSSDAYASELGDYTPPENYASDAERYVYTSGFVVVNSPEVPYANIRSNPSTDAEVKYQYENGRTLDYLGDSVQEGNRTWYHVGYYAWYGNDNYYENGWISSNVADLN